MNAPYENVILRKLQDALETDARNDDLVDIATRAKQAEHMRKLEFAEKERLADYAFHAIDFIVDECRRQVSAAVWRRIYSINSGEFEDSVDGNGELFSDLTDCGFNWLTGWACQGYPVVDEDDPESPERQSGR